MVFDKLSYKIYNCKQILQHQTEDLPAFLAFSGLCLSHPKTFYIGSTHSRCSTESNFWFQTSAHFLTLKAVIFFLYLLTYLKAVPPEQSK